MQLGRYIPSVDHSTELHTIYLVWFAKKDALRIRIKSKRLHHCFYPRFSFRIALVAWKLVETFRAERRCLPDRNGRIH